MATESAALTGVRSRFRVSIPLLIVLAASALALTLLLPLNGPFPWWLLVLLALGFLAWQSSVPFSAETDQALIPIVAALCCIGILTITRLDPYLGVHQVISMLVGLAIVVLGQRFLLQYQKLSGVTYLWVIVSLALFVLLRFFGSEVNGARLWFKIGSLTAQPVEAIKLFMVFFMAAYLAKNGAALSALRGSALLANLRLLWPLILVWGMSIASLVLQRDIGMAGLFLGIFLVMLYVATRRLDLVLASALIFVIGAWLVAQNFPYVQARIAIWRDPWSDPLGRGYQAEQAYFSMAAGGLFGTGYHLGHPGFVPDAATDYPFAAIAEEFGLFGALAILALYAALVIRGMRIAFYAADTFTSLLATGFAATLGIQVALIIGGVIGLFPLTGITLPFISYGGSSVVANFVMLNFLWLFSAQARPKPSLGVPDEDRREAGGAGDQALADGSEQGRINREREAAET
ncbi:MAG TPA: FtsW/RodA/SpoVE family cell cycle protein [Candidatus Eremiobacteraceae bacterium]|nr:FtsW/RodA/SpoVE family cell cycle protein [Candidatus Eremiobacteraceae bacterium]